MISNTIHLCRGNSFIIEIQLLTKRKTNSTGTFDAIKDIDPSIADGDVFVIIGISGAVKSTLVRFINYNVIPPYQIIQRRNNF